MLYEMTITAPNQSGFFSKIMMTVRRRNCQPNAQKREVQGDAQVVTLTLQGPDDLVNGLAKDIEAVGTVVKLTPIQPSAGPIRVGRQVINASQSPEQLRSSFPEAPPMPDAPAKPATTTIRVGRQFIQVTAAEAADAADSEISEIAAEPATSLRVGRQILGLGAETRQPSSTRSQISMESARPGEYAGGHFSMTGMAR